MTYESKEYNLTLPNKLYKKLENLAVGFDTPINVIERLIQDYEKKFIEKDVTALKKQNAFRESTKTTDKMIEKLYVLSKEVYVDKISIIKAQDIMVNELDMHRGSARMYIEAFLKMMTGEYYTRSINKTATEYYLKNIYSDYGKEALKNALTALKEHIEYYQNCSHSPCHSLNKIYEKWIYLSDWWYWKTVWAKVRW